MSSDVKQPEEEAVRVSMLGPFHVRDDTGDPVPVGGRQVRTLLILLAVEAGRIVPGSVLAARLWPDAVGTAGRAGRHAGRHAEPADPANALQTLVSRLRAALRPARFDGLVESHPAGYKLAVPAGDVDILAFDAAVTAGRGELARGAVAAAARTLDEALALWRGQPFAEAADNEYLAALAVRLAELRDAAMLDRCEAGLALGEAASLIGELKRQVAADPLAERPVALLMRALAADGRPAEALSAYAQARERLADELGIDPAPSVEEVYLRILREPGPVPVTDPAGVPATVTTFVGRDTELTEVSKLLGSARLVTLTGPGGVGKTRLAIEAARQLDGRVRFVPLAPVRDPAEVAHAVVDAVAPRDQIFGRRTAADTDLVSRLTAALASRDDVLILDNCEHVIGASAALVARLLADCPRLTVLTTSREPLRIDGETLYHVPVLVEDAAVRLLCDRAASVRPGFQLDAANTAAVIRICRALDGMPLAIELAAVWLRVLSPAHLAERLDDRFALLTGGDRAALPRHQTLRAVVDWSWELLSEPERILVRRLSAFPAGATLAAAERVCAGDGLPRAAVLSALSGIVDKSLLTVDDGERYGMLETVRAYCLQRLAEAGEALALDAAVSDYFLDLAEHLDQRLRGPEQPQAMAELAAEQDNMYGALRFAIGRQDAQAALRFIRALAWFWMLRGGSGEETLAREVYALADQAPDTPVMAEARVICALSANMSSWDVDQMRPALRRGLDALAAHLPAMTTAHPLAMLGEAMLAMCDLDPQRAFDSCDALTRSDDPWLRAAASFFRAAIGGVLGRMEEIEADCCLALGQFRVLGDAWGMAGCLVQLSEFA